VPKPENIYLDNKRGSKVDDNSMMNPLAPAVKEILRAWIFHATDAEIACCPCSNAAPGSGIFPRRRHLDAGVRCALFALAGAESVREVQAAGEIIFRRNTDETR
jgi:hypothetical protein